MTSIFSRLGIRAQLLVAPAIVLVLMAVLGLAGYRGLRDAAHTASASAAETTAVEILRDSNSRQFEGHRFQTLALQAKTRKDFEEMVGEDADVMKESSDGFNEFAKVARTPELRQEALDQAAAMEKIEGERQKLFALYTPGSPLPASAQPLMESLEADIESADESNDKLVEGEQ